MGPQAKRNVARLQGPCDDITIQGGPLEPTYGAQVVFIGGGGGGGVQGRPKDRMLATLLSRDERDQLQAGL